MGRHKKPTAMHLTNGNPSKINLPNEDGYSPLPIDPPCDLLPSAQAIWKELASEYVPKGLLKNTDHDIFRDFCWASAKKRELMIDIDKNGISITNKNGVEQSNPSLMALGKIETMLDRARKRLGFSPVDRPSKGDVPAPGTPQAKQSAAQKAYGKEYQQYD